jgi:hypothetical protein
MDTDEVAQPLLGVVKPPEPQPPDQAEAAVRDAARWVDAELARLRADRATINDQIRGLVAEQERLRRLVRILDA